MDQPFEYLEEQPRSLLSAVGGILSFAAHAGLLAYFFIVHAPAPQVAEPPVRFIELMRGSSANPRQFVEAPGPESAQKPSADAPFSNRNRRASTPDPSGDRETRRPGTAGPYIPGGEVVQSAAMSGAVATEPTPPEAASEKSEASPSFAYRVNNPSLENPNGVDWRSAIREVGKVASLGGADPGSMGGESGFAESGPISFETQWYAWGDYADAMVRRIRVNWYANMPDLVRHGIKGSFTVHFTIHRDGRITDITTLESSDIPPYDFAARKALELSSPLAPLPADFPNATERVTAAFYYNIDPTP